MSCKISKPTSCATLLSPRGPSLALRAIHLVSRLLEVADLCSSNVSDTANRLLKRTDSEGSSSVAEKKSSAVPLFRSGHMSAICAGLGSKGKVGVQRGRKTAGCPSFLPTAVGTASSPPRGAARSRRPQTANPPAEVQRKTPRPLGANTLTQFVSPSHPVPRKAAQNSRCAGTAKNTKKQPPEGDCLHFGFTLRCS